MRSAVEIRALEGARKVIAEGLAMGAGDVLTIFSDETTEKVVQLLRRAAAELHIDVLLHFAPLEEQRRFDARTGLDAEVGRKIEASRAVLTCLSSHSECTGFRTEVLNASTRNNKRVGHMPGITPEILAMVPAMRIDYRTIQMRCEALALALTIGKSARLRSYECPTRPDSAEAYDLEIELGGIGRPAVLSPGRIPLGRWGNLPGGESFIAPIEDTAEGTFVLNGSFKHHVFRDGRALRIQFAGGRVCGLKGPDDLKSKFEALFCSAAAGDESWRKLAELGIGVNRGIRELTGISLFDEKCLGTVHIAIGDNHSYGGATWSKFHEDLVTMKPSLWIDGKIILDRGRFVLAAEDWRQDVGDESIRTDPSWSAVMRGLTTAKVVSGRLKVMQDVGLGRLCSYTVGTDRTSRLLARIYEQIPKGAGRLRISDLEKKLCAGSRAIAKTSLLAGLSILQDHRLVVLRANGEE